MSGKNKPFRLISAATTNKTLIHASSTSGPSVGLIALNVVNLNTEDDCYVKIYDKATTPQMYVAGIPEVPADPEADPPTPLIPAVPAIPADIPILTYYVAKASSIDINCDVNCVRGLGIAITGGVGDDDVTAVGADDVLVNVEYNVGIL